MKLKQLIPILKIMPFIVLVIWALSARLPYFSEIGKDINAYQRAIEELFSGKNPYEWTIKSFSNPDDPGNHGYSYLPGFLYLFGFLYAVALKFPALDFQVLWKIPILLADLGVGFLLFKYLFKRDYLFSLAAAFVWFFNPFSMFRTGYTYVDPIPVLLLLVAMIFLEKDDVLAGATYALAVIFKTFPIALFPVFVLLSKNRIKFLAAGLIVSVAFAVPFMSNIETFTTFLNGSLLVHNERFVQGRPFLFYISYYYNVELFQILPFQFYSLMSMFFGWVLVLIAYFIFKLKNKYILSLIALSNFFLFTPVLNRTYVLWLIPTLILGSYYLFKSKKLVYYLVVILFHIFYSWYLLQWRDCFHIWRP